MSKIHPIALKFIAGCLVVIGGFVIKFGPLEPPEIVVGALLIFIGIGLFVYTGKRSKDAEK